jgi:exosortase/archaeosortase family protein
MKAKKNKSVRKKTGKKINSSEKKLVAKQNYLNASSERKNTANSKILFFVIKFFLIFFILEAIINALDLSPLNNFLTQTACGFFKLSCVENIVVLKEQIFLITNSCTGLVSASILAAVIFSLKKPSIGKKFILLLAGTIVLLLANIPRILLVIYSALNGFDAELMHTITWFVMSAIILLIWYYGTKKITKIKEFGELL